MITFSVFKKSKKSNARIGVIKTPHGEVETPAFVGVATQATIKTLTSAEALQTGLQALIANTYHLHIRPGEDTVKKNGGLHTFMQWDRPLMTDSGGFQVFSLGFGKDYGTGKILKKRSDAVIQKGAQPQKVKITEDGVEFRSYVDGSKLFLGPKESMRIQEKLGADIILAFDECTSPLADYEYNKHAMEKTHRWADMCIKAKQSKQALYGIVQGGKHKDLRQESAHFMASREFQGYGIGGEFGDNKSIMQKMLRWTLAELQENKPRHLLGIGHLSDIELVIKEGVDTFDCIAPTHYARHGYAFISKGQGTRKKEKAAEFEKLDLNNKKYKNDLGSLDKNCECFVCNTYTRSYLHHLIRAYEITPLRLLTFHNLHFFNEYVDNIKNRIKKGDV
ncbi:hypothetical protein A2755_00390 [Candidatus Wolfebacteria bacterium RIFCSPHIGHO2_01_FULL_48_22]|uniref:Queuine tRNA-ribosyltransferase n=1 Tax=Candidatus Wolfebacteria bacterium RIFCSPHIGHO2_01_FULL_48_22 TaxID=1802555 RepID=A0A1F8DVA2_9BACT|nr:MAG: hypothetical protein A2755_00390 [Candidatus Wolfebacteria bacterium RIFCSPHIGHO2_01_FULL_48_22]